MPPPPRSLLQGCRAEFSSLSLGLLHTLPACSSLCSIYLCCSNGLDTPALPSLSGNPTGKSPVFLIFVSLGQHRLAHSRWNECMNQRANCREAVRHTTPPRSEVMAEGTLITEVLRGTQANPRPFRMIDDVIRSFRISELH